jgi:hypothetical protein
LRAGINRLRGGDTVQRELADHHQAEQYQDGKKQRGNDHQQENYRRLDC